MSDASMLRWIADLLDCLKEAQLLKIPVTFTSLDPLVGFVTCSEGRERHSFDSLESLYWLVNGQVVHK